MSDERMLIVSADCHAGPKKMSSYRDYLEKKHHTDYDGYLALVNEYDASLAVARAHGGAAARPGEDGLWDISERERYLDADGICAEIIHAQGATPFAPYPGISGTRKINFKATPEQIAAGCSAYNRWLADFCSSDLNRHRGIARISVADVSGAVAEVERARKAGLRGGIALPILSEDQPKYNDPIYEPLWAACAANEMTINLHGGPNGTYPPCPEAISLILAETDWISHRALWYLIFSGVFERYPKLHLAISEQRTHWVAPLLRELDSIADWSWNRAVWERIKKLPSEYFKSNCFIGASFMSRLECEARGDVGVDRFMWGSDYPHQEGTWPYTDTSLRWTFGCGVPTNELRAMLGENAARCYHIDLKDLQDRAERIGPRESALRVPVAPEQLPKPADMPSWAFRRSGPWH